MNTLAFNQSCRLFAITALIAFLTLTAHAATEMTMPSFSGGSGSLIDPYKISTVKDLTDLADYVDAGEHYYSSKPDVNSTADIYFILMNDIDLTTYLSSTNNGWKPIGIQDNIPFSGNFNGNGHKITGLWTNGKYQYTSSYDGSLVESNWENVGLFGVCYYCNISNLGVEINNAKGGVKNRRSVGGLVGFIYENGKISNCYVKGDISGENDRIGGLVGSNYCGIITGSYAIGHVSGGGNIIGGLVGGNFNNSSCITTATITNSYATGTVSGEGNGIGGLVGENRATITNSYAAGDVSGKQNVGGLVGWNEVGTISNCYATGNVNGGSSSGDSYIGGLVGFHTGSSITNCYASGNVSGFSNVGGLVGINEGSTITNSVAANNSITSTIDAISRIAALITHSGTQSNNYANIAMSVSVGSSTATFTDSDENGIGKSLSELKSFAFYNTAANWHTEAWDIANAANPAKIWQINDGTSLPFFQSESNVPVPPVQHYCGGNGSASTPYQICTAEELAYLADLTNSGGTTMNLYFTLTNDIDLTTYLSGTGNDGGKGWKPIGKLGYSFHGNFNGGGHKITGLWINRPSEFYVGLFGYISTLGSISNLGVEINNAVGGVNGLSYVGGLAGYSEALISNVYVAGNVTGNDGVGGLLGRNEVGSVTNSYAIGDVTGSNVVGGLVGQNIFNSTITNSYAAGNVSGRSNDVGGIAGTNNNGSTITNSVAANNSISSPYNIINRVVGNNTGTLSNSYANSNMTININGSAVTRPESDYNDVGKPLAELKTLTFYNSEANWSIAIGVAPASIWGICTEGSLPYLQWQTQTATPPCAPSTPPVTPPVTPPYTPPYTPPATPVASPAALVKKNTIAKIYDLKGNLIQKQSFANGEYSVSLKHLPKGVYFVTINNESFVRVVVK